MLHNCVHTFASACIFSKALHRALYLAAESLSTVLNEIATDNTKSASVALMLMDKNVHYALPPWPTICLIMFNGNDPVFGRYLPVA